MTFIKHNGQWKRTTGVKLTSDTMCTLYTRTYGRDNGRYLYFEIGAVIDNNTIVKRTDSWDNWNNVNKGAGVKGIIQDMSRSTTTGVHVVKNLTNKSLYNQNGDIALNPNQQAGAYTDLGGVTFYYRDTLANALSIIFTKY